MTDAEKYLNTIRDCVSGAGKVVIDFDEDHLRRHGENLFVISGYTLSKDCKPVVGVTVSGHTLEDALEALTDAAFKKGN